MVKDPKGRNEPGYDRHVFICGHHRESGNPRGSCSSKNSLEVMRTLKIMAKKSGLNKVRVQKSGCLDFCENGISCVIYPEATWYTLDGSQEQLTRILENHLENGTIVEDALMDISEDSNK